jgi:hypothetical protein
MSSHSCLEHLGMFTELEGNHSLTYSSDAVLQIPADPSSSPVPADLDRHGYYNNLLGSLIFM